LTTLSIVIPTYNERENLPILVAAIDNCLSDSDYELIIVDDNSPDGTGELAEELAREKPIKVVHRRGKLGLASAVIEGFRHSEGEILGVMDADLQHPPETIPSLLKEIEKADIAVASRYVKGGGVEGWTFTREIISKVAKIVPQFLFAKIRPIRDPLSGCFLLKRGVIEGIDLNPIGYKILLEILVKGRYKSVVEVPYTFKGREMGRSTFGTSEQINYLRHLWRLVKSERETTRFIKFCLVGLSGVLVNMGLLALFTEVVGLFYIISAAIGIEISILNNFTWNELWTFRDRRTLTLKSVFTRITKFNLVSLVGLGMNMGMLFVLTEFLDMHYLLSEIFGIMVATLWNFIFNKWWTWQ